MTNVTLTVPDKLKKDMDHFRYINWSEVAREAIKARIALLKEMDEFFKDSTLTEEDTIILGRELKKRAHERMKKVEK